MAMNLDGNKSSSTKPGQTGNEWKAQAFLNFAMPGKVGKIGKIALKKSIPAHAQIIEALTAGGELEAKLNQRFRISYNPIDVSPTFELEGVEFDGEFSIDEPEQEKALGYFNLDLVDDDGREARIGGVPLYEKKPNQKWLLQVMKVSQKNVDAVLAQLKMDFQSAVPRALNFASLKA